ncbi:response regulator [Xanthomonas sontii]|uniref:response regulator n=1 Tax=Xanthomonas sontii TaxID=2650745 RepID=UPI0011E4984B|nr:response regulator [Xanthomonas sontii]MDQ7759447.1 response regulator [Xanthomonas sontii]TYD34832.1 two-component system response regulator [Xanthomonas sontii]UZK07129.1 response regulator [Xanthomonas sontii]
MKILVVDDYRTMRRVIRMLLGQLGYDDVVEAADGEAALAAMRAEKIGLVISDWNMAPMTGLELLRAVRSDAQLKGTPFLMTVTEGRSDKVIEIREAGVSGYIVKPFNADMLKEKIASAL